MNFIVKYYSNCVKGLMINIISLQRISSVIGGISTPQSNLIASFRRQRNCNLKQRKFMYTLGNVLKYFSVYTPISFYYVDICQQRRLFTNHILCLLSGTSCSLNSNWQLPLLKLNVAHLKTFETYFFIYFWTNLLVRHEIERDFMKLYCSF